MSPALQILNSVLRLTLVLWRAVVSNGADADIIALADFDQIIKHFFAYFPYGNEMTGLSSSEVMYIRSSNVLFLMPILGRYYAPGYEHSLLRNDSSLFACPA